MALVAACGGGAEQANRAPTAIVENARVTTGNGVVVDGSRSSDPDGDELTYTWQLVSRPSFSAAELQGTSPSRAGHTAFVPDYDGDYTVSLVVDDGQLSSSPATAVVTASSPANLVPSVQDFAPDAPAGTPGDTFTFSWLARDRNGDELTCTLDPLGGETVQIVIDDCAANAQAVYAYDTAGSYRARLTVADGNSGVTIAESDVEIGGAAVSVRIARPEPTIGSPVLVGTTLYVVVTLDPVLLDGVSVRARVAGRETALAYSSSATCTRVPVCYPGFGGELLLDGLARGEHVLQVTVEDGSGVTTLAFRRFVFDEKPVLTVSAPLEESVATPLLGIDAACSDDDVDSPCKIAVSVEGQLAANGEGVLRAEIDVLAAAHPRNVDGRRVTISVRATDSREQTTYVTREVFVETSDRLVPVASFEGRILDVLGERVLHRPVSVDPTDPFGDRLIESLSIHDMASGAQTAVTVPAQTSVHRGFLTPGGAAYESGNRPERIYEWANDTLIDLGEGQDLAVAGGYALWTAAQYSRVNPGVGWGEELWLRELASADNVQVSADADLVEHRVAANGVVAFASHGQLYVYRAGVTQALIVDPYDNSGVVTDGERFVYRKRADNPCTNCSGGVTRYYAIAYHDGTSETRLTDWEFRNDGIPWPGTEYRIVDGWVAFTRIGEFDQKEVWTRDPQGVVLRHTPFGDSSDIDGLGSDGSVVLRNRGRRYLSTAVSGLVDVSSRLGSSFHLAGVWHVAIGRTLFRVR